jgi:hypothetical protein
MNREGESTEGALAPDFDRRLALPFRGLGTAAEAGAPGRPFREFDRARGFPTLFKGGAR